MGLPENYGPYPSAQSTAQLKEQVLVSGNNFVGTDFTNLVAAGSNVTCLYLVVNPLASSAGLTLTMKGAAGDVGFQVSSQMPSFVPTTPQSNGNGGGNCIVNSSSAGVIQIGLL
jgi:hypothetical protein